jgi:hypothetical protein
MYQDNTVEHRDNHDSSMETETFVSNEQYHCVYRRRHRSLINVEHDRPISCDNQDRARRIKFNKAT